MKSAAKNPEKIAKKPLKPHGTGILRLKVLNILLSASHPLTAAEIIALLIIKPSNQTLYQVLYEIGISFDQIQIMKVQQRAGKSRAAAFFVTLNPSNNVQFSQRQTSAASQHGSRNGKAIPDGQKHQRSHNGVEGVHRKRRGQSWIQASLFGGANA